MTDEYMSTRLVFDNCIKCEYAKYLDPETEACPACLGWKRVTIDGKHVYIIPSQEENK